MTLKTIRLFGAIGAEVCGADLRYIDDNAFGGRGLDIDIVDPDPGAADDLEVRCGGDDVCVRFAGGANGEAVILVDDGDQLVFRQADLDVGFDAAIFEDIDGGGAEIVSD